ERAAGQIEMALRLTARPPDAAGARGWAPVALRLSALDAASVASLWRHLEQFVAAQRGSGRLEARRRQQSDAWLWERIDSGLRARFRDDAAVRAALPGTIEAIRSGRLPVTVAARRLLGLFTAETRPAEAGGVTRP
ncbi:MAG: methylmalonyl Co-A mutase-associated GTPase MeaB, partial [Pseudomonadota bacterium]|nr:methylmalonyl Co-A mutase-associated GTPase MeaB [Pseudomonadota bacterium]